jgi:hypothetical protein
MSDEILLADLVLPSRLRHLCAREGWRTLGELRDAVADGLVKRIPHVGPITAALAKTICVDPERWRRDPAGLDDATENAGSRSG